ncbi:TPA: hypothetical protein JG832_002456 [Enterobacter hormaechei subsp. xiangfangensis]|nr:hypothetical protein [Enterobacter hormaechei subsp. xiangfangensis]HAV1890592.1 hypothetical protein [Enterobacter hormaechei subsp. xiangfangensis]
METQTRRREPRRLMGGRPTKIALEEMFRAEGYELEFKRGGQFPGIRLYRPNEPERWGWMINPATDAPVRYPRDLTLDGWNAALKSNVRRLNSLKLATKEGEGYSEVG